MTVSELIELLQKEDPSAVVCIHDDQGINPVNDEPKTHRVYGYECFILRASSWP